MRIPAPSTLIVALLALFVAGLIWVGIPRHADPESAAAPAGGEPGRVSVNGITLRSISVDLPVDTAFYPDGPHADVVNANCTACHSAAMALYQPRLSADEWRKEVEKMRNTFDAPIDEADVPVIVDYLVAMSAKLPKAREDGS